MRFGSSLIGVIAIGCAAPSAPPVRTASPATISKPAPGRASSVVKVLPAGIFFRAHTYRPCPHVEESEQAQSGLCTEPRVAVVSGVLSSERAAKRALDAARALDLAVGYPFAAHSDELGLEDAAREGTAVILGLFASAADAKAWLSDHPIAGAETVGLLDAEAAFVRHDQSQKRFAVMIDSEKPVPAYAARHFEWRDDHEPEGVQPGVTRPLCHVQPGSLFVADERALQSSWYEWAPVSCGRERAYVAWTSTRLTATVWQRANGSAELLQIIEVSCDSPTFEAWDFERNRRSASTDENKTALAPCGG